jgi:hypothetical protein
MRLRRVTYETAKDLDRSLGGVASAASWPDIDIFPTWVSPEDALRYVKEVDVNYSVLDLAIRQSRSTEQWKGLWKAQLTGWQAFRDDAPKTINWMNAKAIMEQADRWSKQLQNWRDDFKAQGTGTAPPPVIAPGQGTSDTSEMLESWAKIAAILGGVAALFVIVRELK